MLISLKVSRPSLSQPCEIFVIVHCLGEVAKNSSSLEKTILTGFLVLMATHANWLLDSYVYGHALQDASVPFDDAGEFADMAEDVYLPQLPADEFPFLNESASALMAAGYEPTQEFAFGLDLVLAALEPLRTSA